MGEFLCFVFGICVGCFASRYRSKIEKIKDVIKDELKS